MLTWQQLIINVVQYKMRGWQHGVCRQEKDILEVNPSSSYTLMCMSLGGSKAEVVALTAGHWPVVG